MSCLNPSAHVASKIPLPVRYMDTAAAYNLWSEVYDTDGNFLQALDTILMRSLLPQFLQQVHSSKPWRLVDLGCGTGRNTVSLLQISGANIVGLDFSPSMLDIARSRLNEELRKIPENRGAASVKLETFDIIQHTNLPRAAVGADAVISTLVLEHIPVHIFFQTASDLLKADGMLLVTNMHSDMGNISQAGFIDPMSGGKIRPKSYAHTIEVVAAEAKNKGFVLQGDFLEREVDEAGSATLGDRAKKWVGVKVWYGMMFRKIGDGRGDHTEETRSPHPPTG